MQLKFFVPVTPVPQPRPRVTVNGTFVPGAHPVHAFKREVATLARFALAGRAATPDPLTVSMLFVLPRPASYRRSAVHTWHAVKPDIDNLAKAVLDALKGVVYKDDNQIVEAYQLKVTAPTGQKPGLHVCLSTATMCDTVVDRFLVEWHRAQVAR